MLKQSEIKSILAHAKRMESRIDTQVEFNEIENYFDHGGDHMKLMVFLANLTMKLKADDKSYIIGAVELPTYYNDTFAPTGKEWWEDITNIFKASIVIENVGQLHFYIHKGEIVLDLIEAHKRNCGLGTYMLNLILDVVEEMGIAIHTYPCDTDPNTASWTEAKLKTLKLRQWFLDFEFTQHYSTAKMSYNA